MGGLVSQYANLAATPTVKVGDAVSTGTIIGSVGGTAALESGLASHIHYALPALRPKSPLAALKDLEIHKVFPRSFALPPAILTRRSEHFGDWHSF